MADIPIAFGRAAAKRIRDAVIKSERAVHPVKQPFSRFPVISGTAVQIMEGIVTNSITAFNSNTNTYGSGQVQILAPSFNSNTNSYQAVNSGSPVTVYNFSVNSGTVNANTHVSFFQRQTLNASMINELNWADC
jgi:hypothetical protein